MGFSELFNADSIDKQVKITVDGQTYTNSDLSLEEMEIEEQLCSNKTLRFGKCEASTFKMRVISDKYQLSDKKISVSVLVENQEYTLGKYKVNSDKPTADRKYKDIVAYDSMHDILNAEVSSWYNTILPDSDSSVTLKQFRSSFLEHLGVEQEEVTLVNDSMIVRRTIEPSKLSGKTVANAIYEINGCFGHIGRDGRFKHVFLKEMKEGIYASETLYVGENVFPRDPVNVEQIKRKHYIKAEYEDFVTAKINKLQIRQEEDDIGCVYGTGDNCYVVQDNFLLYGKSTEELMVIAENMYSVISKVSYRPAHIEAKGNPCLEVGDGIRLATKYEIVSTYILQRTLKGIQALRDIYDAEGERYQRQDANSTKESIIQLKGKTNKLVRTIEETRLEIKDIEKGLSSRITQNAESISTEVSRAKAEEGRLNSLITQTAEQVKIEVSQTYATQSSVQSTVNNLQQQIDGAIETFTGSAVPTLSNAPASSWTTNAIKDTHIGDLYVVNSDGGDYAGFYYRFEKSENTYRWVLLKDSEVTKALQDAEDAMARANAVGDDLKTNYSTTTQMNSAITAKADEIALSVSKTYSTKTEVTTAKLDAISEAAKDATNKANSALTAANNNTSEVLKSYSTTTQMNSAITAKADEITLDVSKIYETKTDAEAKSEELSGKITLNENNITAEVKRAQAQEVELAAAISVNAGNINLKVSKGNVSSEISQEAGKISIKSNRFSLESTNCTIKEDGTISAKNVDLTGKITANSGEIGGFTIGTSAIYSDYRSSFSSSSSGIYIGTDGLSIGASSSQQFKVTAAGEVTILGTSGSITLGSTSSGRMILNKDGISFGESSLTTEITKDKVKVYNNYIDTNGLHCGGTSQYTEVKSTEIKVVHDYDSFIQIGVKDITLGSGDTHKIIHGTTDLMSLMSNAVMIYPTYSLVGKTDGYLGFFGSSTTGTCSKKKTVSTITSTSSATVATNATKINELINALKAYNLIG